MPQVPFISDLKPSGRYVMEDVHKVGGTPAILKYLMAKGLIDGSCMTVTGKAVGCSGFRVQGFGLQHEASMAS